MNGILLEYQPFVPGAFFFVLLGFVGLTIVVSLIALIDLHVSKFKHTADRITWTLLILCTLGLSSYIYFYKRKELVWEKEDPDSSIADVILTPEDIEE